MALQVWLPLNGDTNNQGISDATVTNSGATIDDAGKIGQCYRFNKNALLTLPSSVVTNLSTEASFCLWIKINSFNASWDTYVQLGIDATPWTSYRMGLLRNSSNSNLVFVVSDGSTSTQTSFTTPNITLGTWYHIACVYKTGHCLIYINGSLHSDNTTTIVPNFSTATKVCIGGLSSAYKTDSYINDFRLYDHALSAKEIKELSKGLVLHYPLNCNGNGVPNLADNSGTFDGWSAATGWTKGTSDDGSAMYSFSRTGATSNNWYRLIPTVKIDGNNYPNGITVSMELLTPDKSAINQKCLGSIQTYQANGSRIGWAEPGWDLTNVVNNKWSKVSYNFTQAQLLVNNTSGTTYSYTQFSFQLVQNGNISIRKIKIEPGNTRTPYSLSLTDINDGTEYDTSGYKNNGAHASITIDGSSPRYNASVNYNVANSTTVVGNCFALNSQIPEITVNVWFKTNTLNNTAPNLFSLGQNSFLRARIASSTSVWQYYSVAGTICYNTYSCKNILDNTWHMYTYTFNKGTEIVYIDGAQVGTADNSSTGTYLKVGAISWNLAGYTSGAEKYIGNLSDFRIYSTALTATDIKELYEVSASVDKNGNVWGYELVEDV